MRQDGKADMQVGKSAFAFQHATHRDGRVGEDDTR